jgi:hypothetical protein
LGKKLSNNLLCAHTKSFTQIQNRSCIEFNQRKVVDLVDEQVAWTQNVAAPEMYYKNQFSKSSDVFMACLIIAELMTVEYSDEEFNLKVLKRKENGSVNFSSKTIHARYKPFLQLLKLGLASNADKRPTASSILDYLLQMKKNA